MSAIDVMPLSTSDYIGDTTHLSNAQHGCYLLILMAMWRSGGWLPDDDRIIANVVKLSVPKWKKISGPVRSLLLAEDGKLTQKRLRFEIEKQQKKISKCVQNGIAGGIAKALKNKEPAMANASHSPQKPNEAPTTLNLGLEDSDIKEGSQCVGSKPKREKPRGKLPPDWQMTVAGMEFAADHGFRGQSARALADRFKNHHWAKGTLGADWNAGWRNWVLNEVKFDSRRSNGSGQSGRPSLTDIAMGRRTNDGQ